MRLSGLPLLWRIALRNVLRHPFRTGVAALGVGLGLVAIAILDPWIVSKVEIGASLFRVTPALVASATGFGVGLGVVAGLVPAVRAARSDPAPGLREL